MQSDHERKRTTGFHKSASDNCAPW
jgi:hypothetical protein